MMESDLAPHKTEMSEAECSGERTTGYFIAFMEYSYTGSQHETRLPPRDSPRTL